jgi:ubiquinone/menaquinone biosynthesis C-methylase UbiE
MTILPGELQPLPRNETVACGRARSSPILWLFDRITARWSRWRADLVQNLDGCVLEIGVGTGPNLVHYRRATAVWAIEPDPGRAALAQQVITRARVPTNIKVAVAEDLPFTAASFDHVVSALVFCSVTDQVQALAEAQRVLKPGGALHMVEHVRPETPLLAWWAGVVTPTWSRFAHNCHLDRPTIDVLRSTGWEVEVLRRLGVFVHLRAAR